MQVKNNNWLQSKNDGKQKLSVKFSYVVTIYQVWNNDNTLKILFMSCAINIFFKLNFKKSYPTNIFGNVRTFCPCIVKRKLPYYV